MPPKRRITGKQPPRPEPTGPVLAAGLPKRVRKTQPVMPALLPKLLKRLEDRKKHQGLVDWQRNQRLHEHARNIEGEITRLGTMAGGYLPSLRSGLRPIIGKLMDERDVVRQQIRDSKK